ncbi:MAG: transposase [Rhodothermia bacterium]
MGRAPRIFIEGGVYHVYNRVARGVRVFGEDEEADRFIGLLREVKDRDELTVFAWCVMTTHP